MRLLGLVSAALCASACAFILDFDELSGGSDAGSDAASGGSGGNGDAAGGACSSPCNDNDSCTDDSCDETADPPVCKFTPKVGLVEDGFSTTLSGGAVHRVTMVTGTNAFYLAAFVTSANLNRTTLYELPLRGDTLEPKLEFSDVSVLNGELRSTAGLVADTSLGLQIHAFVAVANADAATATDIWQLVIDGGTFQVRDASLLASDYDATSRQRYPVALRVGSLDVRGAWINTGASITAAARDQAPVTLGEASFAATHLAPLSAQGKLGVLFAGPEGVFTQLEGGPITPVGFCETRAGAYTNVTTAWTELPGFWIGLWTKAGADYLVTEYKTIACSDTACATSNCEADQAQELLRNPAFVIAKRPADAPGVVYQAAAAPFLAPGEGDGGPDGVLLVSLMRIDFGATPLVDPPDIQELATVERARMPAQGSLLRGPDWPAIAMLNDRIALAWIQPAANGGEELRVERLRMCLPP